MIVAMFPVTVLAEPGVHDAVHVRGVEVANTARADANPPATVLENSLEVRVPRAGLDATNESIAYVAGAGTNVAVRYLSAAQDVALQGNTTAFANPTNLDTAVRAAGSDALSATGGAIVPGGVIWVASGTGADALFIRIVVNQRIEGGTIVGDGIVTNAIVNVVIPTDLNFGLNPLQIGNVTDGSQITTTDYRVTNRSNVAVRASFAITTTAAADVSLVEQGETANGTDRRAFFAILGAENVTDGPPTFANPGAGTMQYDSERAGLLVPFPEAAASGSTTSVANVAFALAASTGGPPVDTLATNNRSIGSFQFFGELNDMATWSDNDLRVSAVYTLLPMRSEAFTAIDDNHIAGLNVYVAGGVVTPDGTAAAPFPVRPGQTLAINWPSAGSPANVYFRLVNAPDVAAANVRFAQLSPAHVYDAAAFTWNQAERVVRINHNWATPGMRPLVFTVGTGAAAQQFGIEITVTNP